MLKAPENLMNATSPKCEPKATTSNGEPISMFEISCVDLGSFRPAADGATGNDDASLRKRNDLRHSEALYPSWTSMSPFWFFHFKASWRAGADWPAMSAVGPRKKPPIIFPHCVVLNLPLPQHEANQNSVATLIYCYSCRVRCNPQMQTLETLRWVRIADISKDLLN